MSSIVETIRRQWFFLLLFVGASVATAIGAFTTGEEEGPDTAVAPRPPANPEQAPVYTGPFKPKVTDPMAEAEQHIQEYLEAISEDPAGEDTPLNLRRIGNLYLGRLNDPQRAVDTYEDLLTRFPDWEGNDKVYLNVATCYAKLGDTIREKQNFEKMLGYFEEGSAGHDYALEKLGWK